MHILHKPTFLRVLISCMAVITLNGEADAGSYAITALDSPYGTSLTPLRVNNSGKIAGIAVDSSLTNQAFLYSNGSTALLGNLGGGYSEAKGLSNDDKVVGISTTATDPGWYYSFTYSNGSMNDLGLGRSTAEGINNFGQIVGSVSDNAFLYSNGHLTNLGPGYAADINDNGQLVGSSFFGFFGHAFLYNNGSMNDLGTLGGASSWAYRISSNGQVVGWSDTATGSSHAFLYNGSSMVDLGTLGGTKSGATGVNIYGQVVGNSDLFSDTPYSVTQHPFLFSNGSMVDLNNLLDSGSGWTLLSATGINDSGQIVGTGYLNGQINAFIMTPTSVPVPQAAWLLGSGLVALMGFRRNRPRSQVLH